MWDGETGECLVIFERKKKVAFVGRNNEIANLFSSEWKFPFSSISSLRFLPSVANTDGFTNVTFIP